jgi:hypothetical protein
LFRSFEAIGLLGHPHRLEPLLRTLAVIATLPTRLVAVLLAVVTVMLRSLLAVRAARRRIAATCIDAGLSVPRRLATIGLLLARMRSRAI